MRKTPIDAREGLKDAEEADELGGETLSGDVGDGFKVDFADAHPLADGVDGAWAGRVGQLAAWLKVGTTDYTNHQVPNGGTLGDPTKKLGKPDAGKPPVPFDGGGKQTVIG